jgi:hypothetical protein
LQRFGFIDDFLSLLTCHKGASSHAGAFAFAGLSHMGIGFDTGFLKLETQVFDLGFV